MTLFYYKKYPWKKTYNSIQQRCQNIKTYNYKHYGKRGIKCLITVHELKQIWFRDKAYLMKKPSIDRIDNDGNYCYENCRFIEFSENTRKNKTIKIFQYDLENNFIQEWESARKVQQILKINEGNIGKCLKNIRKTAGGYKWFRKI